MSNLLKKADEPQIAEFGFPVIDSGDTPLQDTGENAGPVQEEAASEQPKPAEMKENLEETYRKQLLELERRGQDIEKAAYASGFAQGEKDGLEYGRKTVDVVKGQLERMAESLEALPEKIYQDYRDWLVAASMKIARHIVRQELRISPEAVGNIVRELLAEAKDSSSLTVYLNPMDLEFMEKRADLAIKPKGENFAVKPDKNLERGGCRVETDIQLLDGSIDTRFDALEDYMANLKEPAPVPAVDTDEQ